MLKISKTEKAAYKMILPYVLIIVSLVVFLLTSNIYLSFTNNEGNFTFSNYIEVIKDPVLPIMLKNTAIWTICSVIGQLSLGLLVAILLNQIKKGEVIFRSIILILPWATLDIVAGVTWKWMFNDMYGVINDILFNFGFISDYISWLGQPKTALAAVIIANIWKGFSLSGLFFLAGLQAIPEQLYEAAEIDGANVFQKFTHVTIPQLKPILITTLMFTTIWTINYFPLIYTMTGGGPGYGTETFVTYIYRTSFKFLEYNKSAALSNFLFLIILFISVLYIKVLTKEENS